MLLKDINYLKEKNISTVVSKGFAELYLKQPDRPIEFLAKWLQNYSKNEK